MPAPLLFPAQCTAASWASALADSRKHPGREREIRLAPGTLHLDQPICLGPEDQGLTISGSGGGESGGGESGGGESGGGATVISGAFPLTDWRPDGDGALAADLPDQTAPRLLLIGDDTKARPLLRPRARFPRQGWLTCLDHPAIAWQGSHGGGWNRPPHPYELTHMTINPDDWPQSVLPANAEVTLFHCWDESTIQVGAIDWSTGVVAFLTPTEHPAGAFGRNAYVLWNIREGLTDPGQWMHDRTRQKVVYRPFPDEDPDRLAARIARPESLFRLLPGADQVTLRDLGLTMTNAPAGSAGLRAVKPPGAVDACQCAGLTLTRLTITHAAGQGIRTCQCPGLAISQCRISNCGAGGITTLESLPADIHDNDVTDVGKTCFSAVAITGGGKSELGFVQDGCVPENGVARIEGNRIEGAPYCGIVCNGGPHLVRNNRLTRVMQTLHDGAAIYASRAEHTVIAGNVIHDIVDDTNKKHALYFDEYSHHAVLDANLVLDCTSPVHAHRAWRCTISNNHFINTGPLHIDANACQNLTLTGNLIASRQDIRLRSNAPQGLILKDDNRLFSASDAISCQNNHDCQPHFFYENDRVAMVQMPETGNPARRWRRLAVFGDSITQTGAFAAELMLHLACRFPEQYTTVLNAGIAGNSAAAGLERLDSDLLPMQPDAVLICFGMNDINRNLFLTPTPDRQQRQAIEQAMQAFNRNLRNIVNRLQQHGITPVLLSPPAYDEYRPGGDDPGAPWANSMGLARLRDIACTLASEHRLYFADLHLALSRLYHRHPELAIAPDRVHPDERGHRVIAAILAAALFPEPPEPRGGLPFPEDDTARAINPWFSLAALRRTGAAALDHRDTRPLRQAAMKYRDADAKTRTFRHAELILAAANAGQLPRRRTDEKAVISKFLATITPRHQGYYNAVLADFQANRHQRKAIFRAADNARQDFFMTLRHLRS